jgi:hypothetical protein
MDGPGAEWIVQVRGTDDERTTEHRVPDVDAFLATLDGPVLVRYTHGSSRFVDRFRDLASTAVSPVTGVPYTRFGWRPPASGAPGA